jgi:hypothetical protein
VLDITCQTTSEGTAVIVEYRDTRKVYKIPGLFNAKAITEVIFAGISGSEHFDLTSKLQAMISRGSAYLTEGKPDEK